MRRRKKTIIALVMMLAGIAALVFWPRDHPAARRAFAAVRGMVEVQPEAKPIAFAEADDDALSPSPIDNGNSGAVLPPPAPPVDAPAPAQNILAQKTTERPAPSPEVEINIAIVKLNLTDARTRLFAETVPSDKLVVGRVASPQSVLEILKALDVASIVSEPQIVLQSGQTGSVHSGGEVAVAPIGVGAPVTYESFGSKVGVHAKITGPDTVSLEFDWQLSYVAGRKTVATPQGPVEQPDVKVVRASARAEVKTGEALFLGGLAQKAFGRVAYKAPYFGELPGIGSWFCFSREREFDEELAVLVTPRIIRR